MELSNRLRGCHEAINDTHAAQISRTAGVLEADDFLGIFLYVLCRSYRPAFPGTEDPGCRKLACTLELVRRFASRVRRSRASAVVAAPRYSRPGAAHRYTSWYTTLTRLCRWWLLRRPMQTSPFHCP
eukprot:COSAG01_NODE_3559_length_5935_cov_2.330535_9_plen_127_part_00